MSEVVDIDRPKKTHSRCDCTLDCQPVKDFIKSFDLLQHVLMAILCFVDSSGNTSGNSLAVEFYVGV